MDEHERLRRLAATLIMELSEAGWVVEADNVQDGVFWLHGDDPATVERVALVETQWQDAPDGPGSYYVRFPGDDADEPPALANISMGDGDVLCSLWLTSGVRTFMFSSINADGLLWSRLPDPPPAPESEGV